MRFNRDENSTLGKVVIGFKDWLENSNLCTVDNISIGIKYRLYIDQLNAKQKLGEPLPDWLDKAVKFDMGICPIYQRPVIIEKGLYSTRDLWCLKMEYTKGWYLGKDAEWYYEEIFNQGMRPDKALKFLENLLFFSPQQVYDFWKAHITEAKQLYTK